MTLYAIMETYGPTDPRFAVHKFEAESERDALAAFAISQGFSDPRDEEDIEEEQGEPWFYCPPPHGRLTMIHANTELVAVPVELG